MVFASISFHSPGLLSTWPPQPWKLRQYTGSLSSVARSCRQEGNVAELRAITINRTQAGEAVVGSGLKAGEQVVVDGQLRLVNGAPVAAKPAQNEAPKPAVPPRG